MGRGAAPQYDAVIVGAGHNGLVAGAYLARAGLRTLILERNERAGGAAATAEFAGAKVPVYAHTIGRLRSSVVRELDLLGHGLRSIRPRVRVFAPQPDGRAITLWGDPGRTAEELRTWSRTDAEAYPRFDRKVRALASFVAHLFASTPPDLKTPSLADAIVGLRLTRAIRGLGSKEHAREVLRVLPMAAADFVAEAFETDALRGAVAARAVQYAALGPWSAGTVAVLLADSAGNDGGAPGQTVFARGGPGALVAALQSAARSFGVEIRTGAEVSAITAERGRATGVALSSGREIRARAVVSCADPKRTLRLVDPVVLGPTLVWRGENIRMPGAVAKVNLVLSGPPRFAGVPAGEADRLRGRILIAPGIDPLERAFDASKYGRISDEPFLEATIPTLSDPDLAHGERHVVSVIAQFAPYHLREGGWDSERDGLGDLVLKTLETYAPGMAGLVEARQVITPLDLERDVGLTEGHPLHGEPGLDQFYAWRPLLGHARYRFGIPGLYLCGSGAHPGGGITGGPGANAARAVLADRRRGRI